MLLHLRTRAFVLLATVFAGVLLTACVSSNHSASSAMMGGRPTPATNSTSSGMMGAGSGYHYSRLTCSAPASLPGHTVNVTLGDMGMTQMMGGTAPIGSHMMLRAAPATVAAGKISLTALNMGWRTHELVIMPLASGASAGQRVPGADGKISEAGSLGEASGSCASGSGAGITAGTVGWTTVTLAPGRYELVCNLANHYLAGMHQEFTVT
jgi:uncharacterized cupredoxin-like copper-binding protein